MTINSRRDVLRAGTAVLLPPASLRSPGSAAASCLQGTAGSAPSKGTFGRELAFVGALGAGPCMDAAVAGGTLYCIGQGKLFLADISNPRSPSVVESMSGLGNVRQIEVHNGIAYITAREDGLFLVDVRNIRRPQLLSHYDTVELATGLAVCGGVAAVACRHPGVELVDVTTPRRPVHLSTTRVGEAQSVALSGGHFYAGVWATQELAVCDVRNPRRPKLVSMTPLDGFGDGVAVRGSLVYVATGHHARATPRAKEGDDAWGRGHGLEIFDVADPSRPRLLSRFKAPPLYRMRFDMWGVQVSGNYAFLADTHNGIFIIDVSDPAQPRAVAHRQLQFVPERGDASPVTGFALAKDYIYVAGGWTDIHVAAAPSLAAPPEMRRQNSLKIPPKAPGRLDGRCQVYRPEGQVQAVVPWKEVDRAPTALVAAGSGGLHVVRLADRPDKVAEYSTDGFAYDVAYFGDYVYVAESNGGLCVWKAGISGELVRVGRYRVPGELVRQVVVTPSGRFAMLHVGGNTLHVVSLREEEPQLVLTAQHGGLFYRRAISQQLLHGRYGICNWQGEGMFLFDLSHAGGPRASGAYRFRVPQQNGGAPLRDRWLVTYRDQYFLLTPGETRPPEQLNPARLDGHLLSGKPTIFGSTLFISNAFTATVTALDVSSVERPKLIGKLGLSEPPGYVIDYRGVALIPAGYEGLLVWKYRS